MKCTTVLFKDMPDYLTAHKLEIKPGSARWEPDPKRPGRLRFAVEVQPEAGQTTPPTNQE